jgi:DNA-directed RNA polymerase subunit RPC12/RpoP
MGICPKCGHDDLYVRENEEELFESYLQCMKCSEEFSHEEVENHNE